MRGLETELDITGLDFEGRGVARVEGRVVFVGGALPDERVRVQITHEKKRFAQAQLLEVLSSSPYRRVAPCRYDERCGGCGFQHVHDEAQMDLKTRVWLEQLLRIGRVQPEELLAPISSKSWHYRSRARLSWHSATQQLGFLERGSHRVVRIEQCLVLPEVVSHRLADIKALCAEVAHAIVAVEIHQGSDVVQVVIHANQKLSPHRFLQSALAWAAEDGIFWQFVLRGGGTQYLPADAPALSYSLPEFGLHIPFTAEDFTQVNPEVNAQMVKRAVEALQLPENAWVLDAFCGLGNFSFALAQSGAQVLGVEGVDEMVQKASALANRLGLEERCRFERADLFSPTKAQLKRFEAYPYWLLDPPRAGAQALVEAVGGRCRPKRIVYVSCDSGTFARDAGILVGKGYRYTKGQLLNMFPQTTHVESLNVFEL
ncbi:MAG: TRAM domain-containing protein [Cardiobacteriaceae bacterium]|nr:TRAM domain-containing protein [Cardiobacteriaceae bacterium]